MYLDRHQLIQYLIELKSNSGLTFKAIANKLQKNIVSFLIIILIT